MLLDEDALSAARNDLLAWAGGGIVWGVVTDAMVGHPTGMLLGATLAWLLRRILRSVAEF